MSNKRLIIVIASSLLLAVAILVVLKLNTSTEKPATETASFVPTEEIIETETDKAEEYHNVTFLLPDGTVDFEMQIKHGECIGYIPNGNWPEGILTEWERTDSHEVLFADTPIMEDVSFRPDYLELELIIRNGMGDMSVGELDAEKFHLLAEYLKNNK